MVQLYYLCQCCGTIFYVSGSGSVPTFEKDMIPVPTFEKLWFRFRFLLHIYEKPPTFLSD
jgi:hypothetical protein